MSHIMVHEEFIKLDKPVSEVRFLSTGAEPSISCLVINQDAEITFLPKGDNIHQPTHIRVETSESFTHVIMSLLECASGHLPMDACLEITVSRITRYII